MMKAKRNKDIVYRGKKWSYVGTRHMLLKKVQCYINPKPGVRQDHDGTSWQFDILIVEKDRLFLHLIFENMGTHYFNLNYISTPKQSQPISKNEIVRVAKIWFDNMEEYGKRSNTNWNDLI